MWRKSSPELFPNMLRVFLYGFRNNAQKYFLHAIRFVPIDMER